MTYKHLFLDSDVILDLLFERHPFAAYTQLLFIDCKSHQIKLSTSVLVIANINYIASKKLGKATMVIKIKELFNWVNILPFEKEAIDFAINSEFSDFEDAIQHNIAIKNNCDAIITRNIKDYKSSAIPVLTAEQFLRTLL